MTKPRFHLAEQVRVLGADSLEQSTEFAHEVDGVFGRFLPVARSAQQLNIRAFVATATGDRNNVVNLVPPAKWFAAGPTFLFLRIIDLSNVCRCYTDPGGTSTSLASQFVRKTHFGTALARGIIRTLLGLAIGVSSELLPSGFVFWASFVRSAIDRICCLYVRPQATFFRKSIYGFSSLVRFSVFFGRACIFLLGHGGIGATFLLQRRPFTGFTFRHKGISALQARNANSKRRNGLSLAAGATLLRLCDRIVVSHFDLPRSAWLEAVSRLQRDTASVLCSRGWA